uniref:Carbonic anhydrase n=1 Tax=Strigamia maritima TaxID=126957 RepID=T1IRQ8_STRMM
YVEHEIEWTYHGPTKGPRHWCSLFDTCCGRSQSPLNLRFGKHDVTLKQNERFSFIKYNVPLESVTLQNTGHTAMLSITNKTISPKISGGRLNKTYVFEALHFHWGSSDVVGSEHEIEGRRYPLEMHLVHYSEEFSSLALAIDSNATDALAVIAVFFNIEFFNNTKLAVITDNLDAIRHRNEKIVVKTSLRLMKLLPSDTSQFFRYQGSLTTPACNEVVTWTLFGIPSYVSKQQMAKFRRLLASEKSEEAPQEMSDNYRPIQDENEREIFIYSN